MRSPSVNWSVWKNSKGGLFHYLKLCEKDIIY